MGIGMAASGEARTLTMRAVRSTNYGPPEALLVDEVPQPRIAEDQVLVRVRAASVNPYDWHMLRGDPWILRWYIGLRRPKGGNRPGVDMAGVVEAVGAHVSEFAVGDEVFGSCSATFAEYTVARERNLVAKSATLTFEQAAAIPAAGVTALQAVRDHAAVKPGTRVLINGASGGVGTFAVQIAKAYGAHVTAVCSTRNLDLVRSIGADDVVDYTVTDFTRGGLAYDVILDNVGNRSLFALRRALRRDGTLVGVAGGKGSRLLGGLLRKWRINKLNRFVAQRLVAFHATINKEDMTAVSQLIESGAVMPVIDRTYPLISAAEAIRYLENGHASGKVVIRV